MKATVTDTKPWYRQLWPWVLIGIPGSSIIYCSIFITLAVTTENSLVSDSYYKDGLAINQMLERDYAASQRGLGAEYMLDGDILNVHLIGGEALAADALILRMIHPTLESRDALVRLARVDATHFRARLSESVKGHWYLDLRDASNEWRLYGKAEFPAEQPILVTAPTPN